MTEYDKRRVEELYALLIHIGHSNVNVRPILRELVKLHGFDDEVIVGTAGQFIEVGKVSK